MKQRSSPSCAPSRTETLREPVPSKDTSTTRMKPPCDEAEIRSHIDDKPCSRNQGGWVLVATILASSMAFIDSTVVNVALPALQTSFNASVVGVQWVVESYGFALAALILVGGSMGDLFGRRRMFLLGVAVFSSGVDRLRPVFESWAVNCRSRNSRNRRCISRARKPCSHQRIVRRGAARTGHRHLVRIHCNHNSDRAGVRRLAYPTFVVEMGLLPQCASGGGSHRC